MTDSSVYRDQPGGESEFGQPNDEIRVHSQDPAEGADPDDTTPDQPRVHSEDAAEG